MTQASGLILERRSRKDFSYDKIFGAAFGGEAIKPLGRREEIEASPLATSPIYQDDIPACVPCSFTFINQYFTWKQTDQLSKLSWQFLFAVSNPQPAGTKPRLVADNLRKKGQPLESRYDTAEFRDKSIPLADDFLGAEGYRIKNFSYLTDKSPAALYRACVKAPLAIGVGISYKDTNADVVIANNPPEFYHMMALVDFTEAGDLICANWWNEDRQGWLVLDKGYEISVAMSFEDLPDQVEKDEVRTGLCESLKLALKGTR